ncbi:MAG: amidophosphoribosyltransferase [Ancrocorticia sp.]|uniref:amidophosphoribosyltransferase n=1 Tax=Ancrocorticia sp. TaxID=2593684 RepID=UPI003F8F48C5
MTADGRLSAELFPEDKPQDECGVFGVIQPGQQVSQLVYYGLYSLQHRGQEAAGIAVSGKNQILVYKDVGLVSQVFNDQSLAALRGDLAIGHVRYATSGVRSWENAQPTLGPTPFGTVAMAHNGNLTNTEALVAQVRDLSGPDLRAELGHGSSTDTSVITSMFGLDTQATSLEERALEVFPQLHGAFSLAFMDESTLYAARDRHGFRPLVLGQLDGGWVVASETAALDIVGAEFVREVEPGEMLIITADGQVRSRMWARSSRSGCVFEYVYLARPDTTINGTMVNSARTEMGRVLAREHPVEADLVMPTPESGTPAAIGYAQASGIPYGQGLVKNAYVGRTFIQPTQLARQRGIRLKLNPMREVIEGKRLVVVDDSIVRGNTQRALVAMLRQAGAKEVHVRISSPPVRWPCFFGIDFPTRQELIANGLTMEGIRESIGADSLGYISLDGMVEATGQVPGNLCTGCFTGNYPQGSTPAEKHEMVKQQ